MKAVGPTIASLIDDIGYGSVTKTHKGSG